MKRLATLPVVLAVFALPCRAEEPSLRQEAADALERATVFFTEHVAAEGGYLWRYSADLSRREGEGRAGDTTVWIQPPGTPSVGMAYLAAYRATSGERYLDATRAVASCLVRGQLESGGWDYRIEFSPAARERYAYRVEQKPGPRNVTTLDDRNTQAALGFLMRLDETLGFKEEAVHGAVQYALGKLLEAQYPNGAWPQRFSRPPDPNEFPVKRANYPETWSREYEGKSYAHYYTFNDNTIADMIATMFDAAAIYDSDEYRRSALKAGNFILLAQMPDPQPGWAQQYDADMHPAWARKFEPPAISGGEGQQVMRTLIDLYRRSGDAKYLEPIPRALEYYRASQLPDGRLARFYELKTNKPLYFTREYALTYRPDDLPTHYGFIVSSKLDSIEREFERVRKLAPEELRPPRRAGRPGPPGEGLIARTRAVIDALDEQGRWVEDGRLARHDYEGPILSCRTFIRNVETLAAYLAATRSE